MAECDYCGEGFDEEAALLEHMRDAHEGELGRIDRRRVAALDDGGGDVPTGPIAIGLVIFVSAAVVAFVIFGGGGGGGAPTEGSIPAPERTPTGGAAHEHGFMDVVVLGDGVDFSQRQYQVQDDAFHFENGNGRVWHAHAEGVTVQYALWTLGIGVPDQDTVVFGGTTYNESAGYEVNVTVDGESVDPTSHVLEGASDSNPGQGDHVRVVVRQANESA